MELKEEKEKDKGRMTRRTAILIYRRVENCFGFAVLNDLKLGGVSKRLRENERRKETLDMKRVKTVSVRETCKNE